MTVPVSDVPPRDPRDPADDETVIVPPSDETVIVPPSDETVVADDWGPEEPVFVERTEEAVPPRRPMPKLWPGLLALLVLVLAGLGALYFISRDDDEPAATTSAATTQTQTETAAPVSVPDVVGTTSSEATQTLRDAGFEVNVVAVPSDRPSGQVVAQNPAAGNEAQKGSSVRINVAQKAAGATTEATTAPATTAPGATTAPAATTAAPEPASVPDVSGQEFADAARAFGEQGLKIAVQYVPSNEAAGRVVAQAQPAGTQRKRGDTVQVNVSVGAQPAEDATVPDVVDRKNVEARQALVSAGFEVLALNLKTNRVRSEDRVASQTPAAAASVPRGSLVVLYLSS